MSGNPVEQLLRSRLKVEPGVLMRLVSCDGRNALDEVKDALGLATFLGQHHVDDLRRLRLAETTLAQEFGALIIGAGNDLFARGPDAVDEGHGRGIGEACQRRRRFVGKTAAYFEWRMVISSKSSTPQRLRFWQTARR